MKDVQIGSIESYTSRLSFAARTQVRLFAQSTILTKDFLACFDITNVVLAEIITYLATGLACVNA